MWQEIERARTQSFDVRRRIVGLMSGTSLDGVDVAVVDLRGSARSLEVSVVAFDSIPYTRSMRERILKNSEPESSSVSELSALQAELALVYAEAVKSTCSKHNIALVDIDLVGSHGQTVYHDPNPETGPGSTLQIGDPSMLAAHLGVAVVGDFRPADIALGGQGAPLVPYFDWAIFSSPDENRILLNLGGIANITILPAGCRRDDVIAFDTGPANVVIDALMQRFSGKTFDKNGAFASSGKADHDLLQNLLDHPYFALPAPKSTGRELFNSNYIDRLVADGYKKGLSDQDIVATATELTVQSVLRSINGPLGAISDFQIAPDRIIVSGGGVHNKVLMSGLSEGLPGSKVDSISQHGMDPDAKEAVCFAVLAYEAMNGVSTGMPSVTGARGRAFLGKICFPGK